MSDWIQTFTGKKVYPLSPRVADIDIRDIAHALSLLCRFGGHCSEFYSVAQHSVYVAYALPDHLRLWGLLHDAAEAYLCDIPSPVKRDPRFVEYRVAEREIMARICDKFGLSTAEPPEVKAEDQAMFSIEAWSLFPKHMVQEWKYVEQDTGERIIPIGPVEAETQFLMLFDALTK